MIKKYYVTEDGLETSLRKTKEYIDKKTRHNWETLENKPFFINFEPVELPPNQNGTPFEVDIMAYSIRRFKIRCPFPGGVPSEEIFKLDREDTYYKGMNSGFVKIVRNGRKLTITCQLDGSLELWVESSRKPLSSIYLSDDVVLQKDLEKTIINAPFTLTDLYNVCYNEGQINIDYDGFCQLLEKDNTIIVVPGGPDYKGYGILNGYLKSALYFSVSFNDEIFTVMSQTSPITNQDIAHRRWDDYQKQLISKKNIKTINNKNLLGYGNLEITDVCVLQDLTISSLDQAIEYGRIQWDSRELEEAIANKKLILIRYSDDLNGLFVLNAYIDDMIYFQVCSDTAIYYGELDAPGQDIIGNRISKIEFYDITISKDLYQDITYSELKTLVNTNSLTPYKKYKITDYVTTAWQEDIRITNKSFDIVVTAKDRSHLCADAYAVAPDFKYWSDINKWEIKYDIYNNEDLYEWACDSEVPVLTTLGTHPSNEFGFTYKTTATKWFTINDNSVGVYVHTFSCDDGNPDVDVFIYDAKYYRVVEGTPTEYETMDLKLPGKGVIYYMKDGFGNEAGYDFKNILFKRYLVDQNAIPSNLVNYPSYKVDANQWQTTAIGFDNPTVISKTDAWQVTADKTENYRWFYTFNRGLDAASDASINGYANYNIISPNYTPELCNTRRLNNTIFIGECFANKLDVFNYENTIMNSYRITLDASCGRNVIIESHDVTIGSDSNGNYIQGSVNINLGISNRFNQIMGSTSLITDSLCEGNYINSQTTHLGANCIGNKIDYGTRKNVIEGETIDMGITSSMITLGSQCMYNDCRGNINLTLESGNNRLFNISGMLNVCIKPIQYKYFTTDPDLTNLDLTEFKDSTNVTIYKDINDVIQTR